MPYVRVAHKITPVRPASSNHRIIVHFPRQNQVVPIRPVLQNPGAIAHLPGNSQITPVRPVLLNQRSNAYLPRQPQAPVIRNNAPRLLPVLQPPTFLRESDFYEEEEQEEQYEEELYNYPTVVVMDQHGTITRQLPIRTPTLIPQQNYPGQQAIRLFTRYFEPRYYNR